MLNINDIKGVIFDYGGTLDSNGKHWAEVLWDAYCEQKAPLTKEQFREAYVYAERYLATRPVIQPEDDFRVLLLKKTDLQVTYLKEKGFLPENNKTNSYSLAVSMQCCIFVRNLIEKEKPLLRKLKNRYPMALVSNFYGNVQSVLSGFGLSEYFDSIIESAVVGVRKPDPAIFGLGVERLGLPASSVAVVGDSYAKDIVPASKIGCRTIWLKGQGWSDEEEESATADVIITDFMELKSVFQLD
jgi:putative hydrolase of the HAD superfamily